MLTVYDDIDVPVRDPVADEAVVLDAVAVDAEVEVEVDVDDE